MNRLADPPKAETRRGVLESLRERGLVNLYARGGEGIARTIDLVLNLRMWAFGIEWRRWRFLHDGPLERTVTVYLGPLSFTTWKARHR